MRPNQPTGRVIGAVLMGGLVGSATREAVARLAAWPDFPVATLIVNLVGSLLLGIYLARREHRRAPGWSLQFWAIGALGSFTTFSAFSLDVVRLLDGGRAGVALAYVVASIVGGVCLAVFGRRLGATA